MTFISDVMERVRPSRPTEDPAFNKENSDSISGVIAKNPLSARMFGDIGKSFDEGKRWTLLQALSDMSNDGALADKTLERLCYDAVQQQIQIDAPSRRKRLIQDMLKQIGWQERGADIAYRMFRDGDLFLQKIYAPSSNPRRLGFIADVVVMPPRTMVRNTNIRDEFDDLNEAFTQVDDIRHGSVARPIAIFPFSKILHARNDAERSEFFRYGRSIWRAAITQFNMVMMLLEDSAIMRHQSTQNLRVHRIGKDAQTYVGPSAVVDYSTKVAQQLKDTSTDLFIDGKTQIEQLGGTKMVMSSVEDIRLMLSILSVALDYPLDLLSGGVSDSSGGEELFRKEVVLSRTIDRIIKKVNYLILIPLINDELKLANAFGEYRIVTKPITFEDRNKRSKRGLLELDSGTISRQTYYEDNRGDRPWEEEKKRIEQDAEWTQMLADTWPSYISMIGGSTMSASAGETGNPKEVDNQQERITPGQVGAENREDS